jgi:hypothetical protein
MAPFWIPPGQRQALERPNDRENFTAHPVMRRSRVDPFNPETGEVWDSSLAIPGVPGGDAARNLPDDLGRLADDGCPHHGDRARSPDMASSDDMPELPDFLRIVGLTGNDRALLDQVAPRTFNEEMLLRKLREDPARATALDRRHLLRMAQRVVAA